MIRGSAWVFVLLATSAQAQAQDATWQGLTLAAWLEKGPHHRPQTLRVSINPDFLGALAALGPGSPLENQALAALESRLRRGAVHLGAFGKAGLDILIKNRGTIRDPRTFAQGVVRSGKLGVSIVLDGMSKSDGNARSIWSGASRFGGSEFFQEMARRLNGADPKAARDILACMSQAWEPIAGAFEAVEPWMDDERSDVRHCAMHVLTRFRPDGLRPLLQELASGRASPKHGDCLAYVVAGQRSPWTAAQKAFVPLLRQCLQTRDSAPSHAAAVLLGQIGPAARAARAELLEAARNATFEDTVRSDAFTALWKIGSPSNSELSAIERVFADTSKKGRHLARQCMNGIHHLGERAVPLVRMALGEVSLRGYAIVVLSRLGPKARDALPDLKTLLSPSSDVRAIGRAILAIDPGHWAAIETKVLELARKETATTTTWMGPATDLVIRHGRPRGAVLEFLAAIYRNPEMMGSRRAAVQAQLVKGGELRPIVEALIGRRIVVHENEQLVDTLCSHADLAPAVAWLRKQLDGVEARERARTSAARLVFCGTRSRDPHPTYARLLGAAGEAHWEYLAKMKENEVGLVRECGIAGLGQMARSVRRARDLLIDRLFRLTGGAEGQEIPRRSSPEAAELTAVVNALGCGGQETVEALLRQIRKNAPARTLAVMDALIAAGGDAAAALPTILGLLDHEHRGIATRALEVARNCASAVPRDPKSVSQLVAKLQKAKRMTPLLEVEVLGSLTGFAEQILIAARRCQDPVKRAIVREASGLPPFNSRGKVHDPVAAVLFVPFLTDPDPYVRMNALRQVRRIGWTDADIGRIVNVTVNDPHWAVRFAALSFLRAIPGSRDSVPVLRRCLDDGDRFIRQKAREVLRMWAHR